MKLALLVVCLFFTVRTVNATRIDKAICEGDSVLAGGAFRKQSGVYYDTLTASGGGDSVILTDLKVNRKPRAAFEPDPAIATSEHPFFNFNSFSSVADGASLSYLWSMPYSVAGIGETQRYSTVQNPGDIFYSRDTFPNGRKVYLKVTTEWGCTDFTYSDVVVNPSWNDRVYVPVTDYFAWIYPNPVDRFLNIQF